MAEQRQSIILEVVWLLSDAALLSCTRDEEFDAAGVAKSANLNDDNTLAPAINPSLGKWKGRDEISFTVIITKPTRIVERHSRYED